MKRLYDAGRALLDKSRDNGSTQPFRLDIARITRNSSRLYLDVKVVHPLTALRISTAYISSSCFQSALFAKRRQHRGLQTTGDRLLLAVVQTLFGRHQEASAFILETASRRSIRTNDRLIFSKRVVAIAHSGDISNQKLNINLGFN